MKHTKRLNTDFQHGKLTRREFLKRAAALGLSLPAASAIVAACGPSAAPEAKKETVEFWQFWCGEAGKKEWMDASADAYMEAHPNVTITATCYDKDPLNQAMRVAFGAEEGPDTFYFDPYPYRDIDWANKGWLADLSPYLDADRYVPGYLDPLAYNDAIYGVPVEGYVMNMWYNVGVLDDLGWKIPEDRNVEIDEFEERCRELKAKGISPTAVGHIGVPHYAAVLVGCMLYRYLGIDRYKELGAGTLSWMESDVKEAVTRCKGWFDEGFVNADAAAINSPDSYSMMFQGKAAMNYRGGWILGQAANPPEKGGAPEGTKIDYFRFPILPGGPGNNMVDGGTGGCFGVHAQSKVLETTADYLKFLSSEEWGQKWIASTSGLTGIKAAPPSGVDPLVIAQAEQTEKDDIVLRVDTQTHGALRDMWIHEAGPELSLAQIGVDEFLTKLEDARKQDLG
jgi:ABC-type glycerol-3-phosphate transport system substrate-binding protein